MLRLIIKVRYSRSASLCNELSRIHEMRSAVIDDQWCVIVSCLSYLRFDVRLVGPMYKVPSMERFLWLPIAHLQLVRVNTIHLVAYAIMTRVVLSMQGYCFKLLLLVVVTNGWRERGATQGAYPIHYPRAICGSRDLLLRLCSSRLLEWYLLRSVLIDAATNSFVVAQILVSDI